jgi:hypothetical protein
VLVPEGRATLIPRLVTESLALEGVEHVLHRIDGEAVLRTPAGGELRFAPGEQVRDARGAGWSLDGDLGVLHARVEDDLLVTPDGHVNLTEAIPKAPAEVEACCVR